MAGAGSVVLRPPVEVMRPHRADQVPSAADLPGGVQYSPKLDGFRCVAFVLEDGQVVLQSRAGRHLEDDFPQVASALARQLPVGVVLDGELCAWDRGRLAFEALLRSRRGRDAAGIPVTFAAFDVLAVPGRDLRALPLRERWAQLEVLLRGVVPPVERVLATTDRAVAMEWWTSLSAVGVEGLVCRGLATPYRVRR
ncbi:ATP-dependent DNA ligase, partial [Streptomyces alkaliterrae]|nr:DNA ligase [Streptomyces alkaliterrae]